MAMFKKVGIVGTGLVGGSLALALKKKHLACTVVGVSRQPATLVRAKALKAIDAGSTDLDILKQCDLVVLATPVQTIITQIKIISNIITQDCIVIDVASTKEEVVSKAGKLFTKFVGCHPLAGSQEHGIMCARADLFEKALCIITCVKTTNPAALATITTMWRKLGSKPEILDPYTHDKVLAFMSHLPHVLAFALMASTPRKYLPFAAQSFRDLTRIASSNAQLWDDIFITNRKNLMQSIDSFSTIFNDMRTAIKNNDAAALNRIMTTALRKRQLLP